MPPELGRDADPIRMSLDVPQGAPTRPPAAFHADMGSVSLWPRTRGVGRGDEMKSSSAHVVAIIEAIYREERSERRWIEGILAAARPALDHGLGLTAYPFEVVEQEVRVSWAKVLGTPPGVGPSMVKSVMARSRETPQVSRIYRCTPTCATASELGLSEAPGFRLYRTKGILDASGITGFDTAGRGVFFGAFLPRVSGLDPAFRARFERVAAHLGVGQRYRRFARAAGRAPEAVFTPGAKLLHAEGDATLPRARAALARAVVAIDRARGRQRRTDPDSALASWKGLVDARWSLVDEFESDGKRFVVARENEPHAMQLAALSKRERQVVGYVVLGHASKLIAYELGIADSTVRVLLRRAMQRLNVTSREALVAKCVAASSPP
jgi:DNA-binding CsgD family transcriptional regulator